MEELKDRLNRMEAELSAVRAEASAMREQTAGMRRQNAMLRLAMVAVVAVWFLIGPTASTKKDGGAQVPALQKNAVQDVVRAKKLEIVDGQGKTRIGLEMKRLNPTDAAYPLFTMYNEDGFRRVELRVDDFESAIKLFDDKHNARVTFAATADSTFSALADKWGGERARLWVKDEIPYLELVDRDGSTIWWQAPPKK